MVLLSGGRRWNNRCILGRYCRAWRQSVWLFPLWCAWVALGQLGSAASSSCFVIASGLASPIRRGTNDLGRIPTWSFTGTSSAHSLSSTVFTDHISLNVGAVESAGTGLDSVPKESDKKKTIASLGASAFLSYWCVKVLKHSTISFVAWYLVSKSTGVSPLKKWSTFLSVYASSYLAISAFQPLKYAGILAFTPVMERFLSFLMRRLNISKKVAVAATLSVLTVGGTCIGLSGILCASILTRVPIWG